MNSTDKEPDPEAGAYSDQYYARIEENPNARNVETNTGQVQSNQIDSNEQMMNNSGNQSNAYNEEVVQVVYQSGQNGSLVGVESSLLGEPMTLDTAPPQYATVEPRQANSSVTNQTVEASSDHDSQAPNQDRVESTGLNQSSSTPPLVDLASETNEPPPNEVANQDPSVRGEFPTEHKENIEEIQDEISQILARNKQGAAESGSFRQSNFRKKLGLSISTNENDLTAYRQKFLESQEGTGGGPLVKGPAASDVGSGFVDSSANSKFKRTHSVSFNMNSSRSNRHSVDIRNLPSYLTHKRASIVDVAKGAMSSLISSFGGGGSGAGSSIGSGGQRRRSSTDPQKNRDDDEEPIFEEPIAPTLSLGQRVALVRNSGAEFGTVGWIGQLPDVEDDWIVGVIFDNMIGNCDGAYNGTRYFYARENYAMFVPLSMLTKTDNYIGRPETGTMLSRMSISLKPGQLISIQRSSIRLQHCFLNAPHQRVGHDVRAVSNRLHCQCHNCGPCAHLTKQGRMATLPHFGAKHLTHHKKNSLAHAAVEMLAHHHHHFHDEEEDHDEKDYQFGDNAAHACNYVRYSCCQQNGVGGHEFLNDCEMVRPELLDNLIHAPKAPHRRSRPRRSRGGRQAGKNYLNERRMDAIDCMNVGGERRAIGGMEPMPSLAIASTAIIAPALTDAQQTMAGNQSTLDRTGTIQSSWLGSETNTGDRDYADASGSASYSSGCSSSGSSSRSSSPSLPDRQLAPNGFTEQQQQQNQLYDNNSSSYRPVSVGAYTTTMDSQVSYSDQRRFIYQRDSSAMIHHYQASNVSDDQISQTAGGCFSCFKRRKGKRKLERKLSARDRIQEYRRRQSTFVPSTLAKPQEDFASHGLPYPSTSLGAAAALPMAENNSDYSSYSRSSSSSPDRLVQPSCVGEEAQQQGQTFGSIEQQRATDHDGQLKSSIQYGDYSFDDSLKKQHDLSRDSALFDLGYSGSYKTNSSSDTLKQLVDQSINEEEPIQLPDIQEDQQLVISPISSADDANQMSEQIEVSSPTASVITNENDERDRYEDESSSLQRGVEDLNLDSNQKDDSN